MINCCFVSHLLDNKCRPDVIRNTFWLVSFIFLAKYNCRAYIWVWVWVRLSQTVMMQVCLAQKNILSHWMNCTLCSDPDSLTVESLPVPPARRLPPIPGLFTQLTISLIFTVECILSVPWKVIPLVHILPWL